MKSSKVPPYPPTLQVQGVAVEKQFAGTAFGAFTWALNQALSKEPIGVGVRVDKLFSVTKAAFSTANEICQARYRSTGLPHLHFE